MIITSNNEKELPDAFLRRCVFHFIDFPDRELMRRIVDVHHPELDDAAASTRRSCTFYALRELPRLRKRPSTSELIDWIAVLQPRGHHAREARRAPPVPRRAAQEGAGHRGRRRRRERGGRSDKWQRSRPRTTSSGELGGRCSSTSSTSCAAPGAGRHAGVAGADARRSSRACTTARSTASTTWRARCCVNREAHLDAFDRRLRASTSRASRRAASRSTEELLEWLEGPEEPRRAHRRGARAARAARLSRSCCGSVRGALARAEGAPRRRQPWIGTGGTSPFGHGGEHPTGIRVGGDGRQPLGDAGAPTSAASATTAATWCSTSARSRSRCASCARSRARAPRRARPRRDHRRDGKNAGELEWSSAPPRRNTRGDPADGRRRLDGSRTPSWCAGSSAPRRAPSHFASFAPTTSTTASTAASTRTPSSAARVAADRRSLRAVDRARSW